MSPATVGTDEVAALVAAQLGRKLPHRTILGADTELEAVGLSSLDITEIYFQIEERVGVELDPGAASGVKTIGDLVAVVDELIAQAEAAQPTEHAA
jgi:acyl carrier protein